MDKNDAKALIEGCLSFSSDRKVNEEECPVVFQALESLCQAYPSFAVSLDVCKAELGLLVLKCKQNVDQVLKASVIWALKAKISQEKQLLEEEKKDC